MRRIAVILGLAAGCVVPVGPVVVEEYVPSAIHRSERTAVLHPAGRSFALDPNLLQLEVANFLRAAGFVKISLLPPGVSEEREARYFVTVGSELMARPLGDSIDPEVTFRGERVLAFLELRDGAGTPLFRSVLVKGLSSALTEPRVAGALVHPLAP